MNGALSNGKCSTTGFLVRGKLNLRASFVFLFYEQLMNFVHFYKFPSLMQHAKNGSEMCFRSVQNHNIAPNTLAELVHSHTRSGYL